jgi:hypothetical protein
LTVAPSLGAEVVGITPRSEAYADRSQTGGRHLLLAPEASVAVGSVTDTRFPITLKAGGHSVVFQRSAIKQAGCPAVVQLRLRPTPDQASWLNAAITVCNTAATYASRIAWQQQIFGKPALHRLLYRDLRGTFTDLGAQAAVGESTRVAGIYANRRSSKKRAHTFRPRAAVPFDASAAIGNGSVCKRKALPRRGAGCASCPGAKPG